MIHMSEKDSEHKQVQYTYLIYISSLKTTVSILENQNERDFPPSIYKIKGLSKYWTDLFGT